MSRIGKKNIKIPEGITIGINGEIITVKGVKGELKRALRPEISAKVDGGEISFKIAKNTKKSNAFWGLTRSLVNNMVEGVSKGYEKKLEIEGVGFKVALDGKNLSLSLGFSHPVKVEAPKGITFGVEKNMITISGVDKELVGQTAANIRKIKKPEPYKGKGIRYKGEKIRRKSGKKAATSA